MERKLSSNERTKPIHERADAYRLSITVLLGGD